MSPRIKESELLNRLAELPREIRPERDPWPQISARIESAPSGWSRSASRWLPAALAASIVLVFAGGFWLKPWSNSAPVLPTDLTLHAEDTTPLFQSRIGAAEPPGLLDSIDAEYLAAFREFVNVGGARASLAPQTVEKIEMGWAELRVTETALAVALEENPGDLFLNERMLELRARQLGFLKQLISLDRNNRRMTI